MDASIIIATYNRSVSLKRTLRSLERMEVPPEITLGGDRCRQQLQRRDEKGGGGFQRGFSTKSEIYVRERAGKSFALNSGSKTAQGEFLVYTDDDVVVHTDWLESIIKAFHETRAVCVGGRIHLAWEKPRPPWLDAKMLGHLGYLDLGGKPIKLSTQENYRDYGPRLYGANIAVKSTVAEKYGFFNTEMGPKADKMYHAEDTHFIDTLIHSGEDVYYIPDIIVNHCIPEKNLTKKYFRKREFHQGEARGCQWGAYKFRNILGTPLYIFNEFGVHAMKYLWKLVTRPGDAFNEQIRLSHYIGFFWGRYKYTKSLNIPKKWIQLANPPEHV